MSTSAGRVLIIPKGDYNAATTYAMLDMVYYNGSSYVCKQPSTGNLPTNTTYWQIMTGDISGKMDKANPTGTGSFSLNRKASTTVGTNSFAEGNNCTASGSYSHAEGDGTVASEMYSHAEGTSTTASAMAAHAEGESTSATGSYSHAENSMTRATGYASHSEGDHTLASGDQSHAEGFYTQAGYDNQHVSGIYNDNKATTLFEVGNGESSFNRSNAFEVYSDGSISTDNGTTKVKLENLVSQSQALTNEVRGNWATGGVNLFDINNVYALKNASVSNGVLTNTDADSRTYFNCYMWFLDSSRATISSSQIGQYNSNGTFTKDITIPSGTKYIQLGHSGSSKDIYIDANTNIAAGDYKLYFKLTGYNPSTIGGLVVSDIMICDANITDPTYQPYAKTNVELTQALGGFELAIHEGTAPADTTNYKTENIQTILGFKPSYFIILAAERYNSANSIWYQMSNDMTANDYVIKAASDNGVDFRVKFSDVTNYTKYRAVILYKK